MLARTAALGLAWYLLELAFVLFGSASVDRSQVVGAWLSLLPWQLLLFALLGVVLIPIVRVGKLSRRGFGWLAIGGASFLFVGARVGEGALRTASVADAGAKLALLAAAITAALAIAAAWGRWLPATLKRVWPAAVQVGVSLLVVPFARRAGAAIALGELSVREWPGFVSTGSIALAILGVVATLVVGALRGRTPTRAATLLALTAGIALGSPPRDASAQGTDATPRSAPDVVFLLVDTLRDDHVGPRGAEPSLTPNLDAIAAEAIRFEHAYSPGNLTRRAMPGVLASSTERVVGTPLAPEAQTLPMLLREAGYATAGVSANPFVSAHYGYARGFERFSDPSDAPTFLIGSMLQLLLQIDRGITYRLGLAGSDTFYEPAERVYARGLQMLDASPRPAFLYLHTMDVHGPYLPPLRFLPPTYRPDDYVGYSRFLRLSRDEIRAESFAPSLSNVRERYAAGVRHADAAIGTLRAELEARGRWEEALVWITADHGEALGEQGFAGHGVGWLGPTLIRVPLVLKLPRSWGVAPKRIVEPVSTLDIVPTTLALLDRPPLAEAFGADVSAAARNGAAPRDRVLVAWNPSDAGDHYSAVRGAFQLALLVGSDGMRERSLYDLVADPGATRDVAGAHPDIVRELEAAIDSHREREAGLALTRTPGAVDPRLRERLQALGYLDDAP